MSYMCRIQAPFHLSQRHSVSRRAAAAAVQRFRQDGSAVRKLAVDRPLMQRGSQVLRAVRGEGHHMRAARAEGAAGGNKAAQVCGPDSYQFSPSHHGSACRYHMLEPESYHGQPMSCWYRTSFVHLVPFCIFLPVEFSCFVVAKMFVVERLLTFGTSSMGSAPTTRTRVVFSKLFALLGFLFFLLVIAGCLSPLSPPLSPGALWD